MRARNHWGWGWEDKFPDDGMRAGLAAQANAFLGAGTATPGALPSIAQAIDRLHAPRIEPPAAIAKFCDASADSRIRHTYGKAYRDQLRGFRGDFSPAPDFVSTPRDEQEIAAVLDACSAARITVTPFGGGTSVVGGVEGNGGCALDLGRLDRVLEVDPISRAARIQAGMLGPQIEAALAPQGVTLRHFPQSFEHSTLGGWIATRAGGHFATLYTHIDDLVEAIRMITPAAGVWQSRRLPGSGAGPSPDRLALGSEGILGVITEAWVRVQSTPRFRASASVLFPELGLAAGAARAIAQSGLYPSNCRVLDAREALLNGVAADGKHVLLLAFESADHALVPWIERAIALAVDAGGSCPRGPLYKEEHRSADGEAGRWRDAFFRAPYLQSAMISLGVIADTFETACTWDRFDALHAGVTAAVEDALRRICGAGIVTCRFTHVYPDGPAPYFTFLGPARRGAELEQWAQIKAAASDALLAHGGTITHHHAVGRTHRPWYDRQRPDPFALALSAAKRILDPAGILNPDVLVPNLDRNPQPS
jgi:alkyldihydroxyacetonephosphate synthase